MVNCNLQRLDGPVRGNGKIIQELESDFRGAGWNVIKVIWGTRWDPLLAADTDGRLAKVMEDCVDGEYQTFKGYKMDASGEGQMVTHQAKKMTEDALLASGTASSCR